MLNQNQEVVETSDRRIAKGMVVVMSCKIVQIDNEDRGTYKVQSETDVNKYYIVKFMDRTPVYCSCKDFEIQSQKNRNHICKHQRAIVLAENYGLVTTKRETKSQNNIVEETFECVQTNVIEYSSTINDNEDESSNSRSYQSQNNVAKFEDARVPKSSYKDDDYSF